jgi:formiminotetrahydrofolate cyclodeaminase
VPDEHLTGIVAAAAISASLAVRTLRIVLDVRERSQPSQRLRELSALASGEVEHLDQLAREDGEAYAAYMAARRSQSADVQVALSKAIESPLSAAQAALAGMELCHEAAGLLRGALAADVRGAAVLLNGAVRAILCTVDVNLREVDNASVAERFRAARNELEQKALEFSDAVTRDA